MNMVMMNAMGLTLWWPRSVRHPELPFKTWKICASPLIFNAQCFVLLPVYQLKCGKRDLKESKILQGMLNVLELPEKTICVAKIYAQQPKLNERDWKEIFDEISMLQPFFVLQLERDVKSSFIDQRLMRTYCPTHLLEHPEDKKVTYQHLLILKQRLRELT